MQPPSDPLRFTACNRDCPDTCRLTLEFDQEGQPKKIKGDPDDPFTQGFLCPRTTRFLVRQNSPQRVTTPLLKTSIGKWQPLKWDRALQLVADRFQKAKDHHGGSSILNYRGGGSLGISKVLTDYLFELWGPVTIKRGDLCSGPGEKAQELDFGLCESPDLDQLARADLILVWGRDVATSSPHLLPKLLGYKKSGCTIIQINPTPTKMSSWACLDLRIKPGGDLYLALWLCQKLLIHSTFDPQAPDYCDHWEAFREWVLHFDPKELLERCDLSAEQLSPLYQAFSDPNLRISTLIGWGLARRSLGGSAVRVLDALALISGNIGREGTGAYYYCQRRTNYDHSFIQGATKAPRTFLETKLGQEILDADPPVLCGWFSCSNPSSMLPNSHKVRQAIRGIDFTVLVDTHLTDTSQDVDLFLPTLTLLEDQDLLGSYGTHTLKASHPLLSPPGQALHELEILARLAKKWKLEKEFPNDLNYWHQKLAQPLLDQGITLQDLERGSVEKPDKPGVLFHNFRFPTPTGRAQLIHHLPSHLSIKQDPRYPYQLLACSHPKSQSSQWNEDQPPFPKAQVHPSTTSLADGDPIWVISQIGQLEAILSLNPKLHPSVLSLPKGGQSRDGWCPNTLIQDRVSDIGEGANLYEEPVRIAPRG